MKRREGRDDLLIKLFGDESNKDKKVNIEFHVNEKDGKEIPFIVKGKSGISDKPCTQKQVENIIKIIREALTNKNVKFKAYKRNY